MSNAVDLLRLLEPAVRPGAAGVSRPQGGGSAPLEDQSFDQLLSAYKEQSGTPRGETVTPEAAAEAVDKPTAEADVLAPLSGLTVVENPSLRALMAARAQGANESGLDSQTK